AAAIGEGVAQRIVVVATGDAIGKGMRQQVADSVAVWHAAGRAADVQTSAPAFAGLLDGGQRTAVGVATWRAAATIAPGMQDRHARTEIVVACLGAAQWR